MSLKAQKCLQCNNPARVKVPAQATARENMIVFSLPAYDHLDLEAVVGEGGVRVG